MSIRDYSSSSSGKSCDCTQEPHSLDPPELDLTCSCPRDERDLIRHSESCIFYRNEKLIFPGDVDECICDDSSEICKCCLCPIEQCRCVKVDSQDVEEWRSTRPIGALPAVLETNHPLMQKFQQTLKKFLERENELAKEEITALKEKLKASKMKYDEDLENIYKHDHNTNAQRKMIEEYETNLAKSTEERKSVQDKIEQLKDAYTLAKEKLEKNVKTEKESLQEIEALNMLCKQLEEWRGETDGDLSITNRVTEKIKQERIAISSEKRKMDMLIYGLNTEVWKLEAKLELFKKQIEIKTSEMDRVNDRVISYGAELEDLELDKRRLVSLWNDVIVNIKQRDNVFDSVRDDYKALRDSYQTLLNNIDVTKKAIGDEMFNGKVIVMEKDKLNYDSHHVQRTLDSELHKRAALDTRMAELSDAIDMCERDTELVKVENNHLNNQLSHITKDIDKKTEKKMAMENEMLENLQECLLNDKAVEQLANGIKKMRAIARKQEIALLAMEGQHAKILLDIEIYRNQQEHNNRLLEENNQKVAAKEKQLQEMEQEFSNKTLMMMRKQRELDTITKKYFALVEIFGHLSPQARRIDELQKKIYNLAERTEELQGEWVRLQTHVIKMASQQHNIINDVNIISKQIQICSQKSMRTQANIDTVTTERAHLERKIRNLKDKISVLERTKYIAKSRNSEVVKSTNAMTHEYLANLKGAESDVFQLEQEVEDFEKEKESLTDDLDKAQREALIWQRKGIMALDLKRNMQDAKASDGEISQMKNEIHRMELRRDQLRRIADRLSDDLAQCITKREIVLDKSRSQVAADRNHNGTTTSQGQYKHKLKLAKADMNRVAKDVKEVLAKIDFLEKEQQRLENETAEVYGLNSQLEESIATLIRDTINAERKKQQLLERVVRIQRLASEVRKAIKRQSIRVRKPKLQLSEEYSQNIDLNERLREIVDVLATEYPYLEDKLAIISNTLTIHSPTTSPRLLTPDCLCDQEGCICLRHACYCPRLSGSVSETPERDESQNVEIIEEGAERKECDSDKSMPNVRYAAMREDNLTQNQVD